MDNDPFLIGKSVTEIRQRIATAHGHAQRMEWVANALAAIRGHVYEVKLSFNSGNISHTISNNHNMNRIRDIVVEELEKELRTLYDQIKDHGCLP